MSAEGGARMKIKWRIVAAVLVGCGVMGYVDGVVRPGYVAKSLIKLVLFIALPLLCARVDELRALFHSSRRGVWNAVLFGIAVYVLIVGAYFGLRGVFDFSALTGELTAQTGVTRGNFLFVALYISFANSLLEEFFFRGFAFLTLRRFASRRFAYGFSALSFAAYHLAMMRGWFSVWVTLLALLGLTAGGLLFDRVDEPEENILRSWLVHMCANFATNPVGFLLFAA